MKLLYAIIVGSVLFLTPLYGNDWAHGGFMPDRHRGPVNAIIHNGNTILSAGKDGFLELWDANGGQAVQRFQISPYSIIAMAHKPGSEEICIVENEGLGQYRISAWNYRRREKIFTVRFTDPIDYIGYSGGGNFILAARTGRTALIFIDAATGNTLQSPQSLAGTVGLAVTGRSERNMMTYLTSGVLSYWDLESGNETSRFNVPANLSSPALFANNRYLAGVSRQGLSVVNAVSGELVATDNSIPNGSMLCSAGDDFICLVQRNKTAELSRYTVDRDGRLVTLGRFALSGATLENAAPSGTDRSITAIAANGATALGTVGGFIILANQDGQERILSTKDRLYITDAAVANESIAFITEGSLTGIIPLDYGRLQDGNTITLEQTGAAYNRITVFSDTDGGQFIFWQDQNSSSRTRPLPVIRSSAGQTLQLSGINLRSSIRTAVSFEGKILFMDSTGNLTVVSPLNNNRPFTFFSVGLLDAAFINHEQIILGRSAISGNSPFLLLNIITRETVPLPYNSQAATTVYRGESGNIYATALSPQSESDDEAGGRSFPSEGIVTSILQLDMSNSVNSTRLFDFYGEDTYFSLTEMSGGNADSNAGRIAATINGEEAAIYSSDEVQKIDRTAGLPLRLIDGGPRLISVDRDGSIAWHDSNSGKLLAVLRLYPNEWALQTEKETVRGSFALAID